MPRAKLKFASTCEFLLPWAGDCVWIWDTQSDAGTSAGENAEGPNGKGSFQGARSFLRLAGFAKAGV